MNKYHRNANKLQHWSKNKWFPDLTQRFILIISHYWFRYWLGACSKAITWANVKKWYIFTPCSHNKLTHWGQATWKDAIDSDKIGSCDGQLPTHTKPLPELMLTNYQKKLYQRTLAHYPRLKKKMSLADLFSYMPSGLHE